MSTDPGKAAQTETRKLAAIMFTDIVGFSRQMRADEARMLRLLEVHNQINNYPPAKPEVFRDVNRSKRLLLHFHAPPKVAVTVKPGALQEGAYFFFLNNSSCSNRRSSASWA